MHSVKISKGKTSVLSGAKAKSLKTAHFSVAIRNHQHTLQSPVMSYNCIYSWKRKEWSIGLLYRHDLQRKSTRGKLTGKHPNSPDHTTLRYQLYQQNIPEAGVLTPTHSCMLLMCENY